MDDVWNKIDGYTKSDNLDSSDDDAPESEGEKLTDSAGIIKTNLSTNTENSPSVETHVEADEESSIEDVDAERDSNVHDSLLNEMRKSQLHCNTEQRNTQEKVNNISAEKKKKKEDLSEMHHKAQVISKSARMSPGDVLSSITNSETMDIEENSQMEEYFDKIRSVQTESNSADSDPEKDSGRTSLSSDISLPEISPASTAVLNTWLMKSKASVARQGSMKARRKPTLMKRKSWTPGMTDSNLDEEDEPTAHNDGTEESATPQTTLENESVEEPMQRTGSCTPTDSSSEDEKEVSKPHLRSAIALPGLGDALKIQLQRSELKRPTALHLVKTAKDAKENEITKEGKTEVAPSKPNWMKEVEKRKKTAPRTPRRKYVTLSGRCTELDDLFEKRKNLKPMEGITTQADQTGEDQDTIARESPRPKSFPAENLIDPQLSKLFEKRRSLQSVEGLDGESVNQEGTTSFRPRSLHMNDREATELDKLFEKRRNLKPMEGMRTEGEQGRVEESPTVRQPVRHRNAHNDQQVSGIFRARFHDGHTKLEPLPTSNAGHVKIATVSEVKMNTTRQEDISEMHSRSRQNHRPQPTVGQVGQIAEFVFDGKSASRAMMGRIPPVGHQRAPDPISVNHNAMQAGSRYDSQSRDDSNQPRYSQDFDSARTGHSVRSPTQERFPRSVVSPTGNAVNKSHSRHGTRFEQSMSGETQMQSFSPRSNDTGCFVDQRSMKLASSYDHENSRGRSEHWVHSRDKSSERLVHSRDKSSERALYSNTTEYKTNSDHQDTHEKSYHGNLPSVLYVENDPPISHSRSFESHSTRNHPPLNIDRNLPPSHLKPLVSPSTPEARYPQSVGSHERRHNGNLNSRTSEDNYIVSPPPEKLRRSTARVESSERDRSYLVNSESKQLSSKGFPNGPSRVKSAKFYSPPGSDVDMDHSRTEQVKPVTVTVKSISESPVRRQVRENGNSGGRNHVSARTQVSGKGAIRHGIRSPVEGRSDPQNSESSALDSEIPKWKQELKEKKRLQQGRGKELLDGNKKRDNIQPEQSGNDLAEWQKRLKGIRKTWDENEDPGKDNNDNVRALENKAELENENEKDVPGFLKEFKAKKTKQKVKVTVTAKSTPSHQDTRVNDDPGTSSDHDLGTYV